METCRISLAKQPFRLAGNVELKRIEKMRENKKKAFTIAKNKPKILKNSQKKSFFFRLRV